MLASMAQIDLFRYNRLFPVTKCKTSICVATATHRRADIFHRSLKDGLFVASISVEL